MSKPSPARYRTTNWSSYNASLRKRGSLLIWVDKDMTWRAPRDGRPGRPAVFSDAAIQFCLSIKVRKREVEALCGEAWRLCLPPRHEVFDAGSWVAVEDGAQGNGEVVDGVHA